MRKLIDANDLYTRFEEIGWWNNDDRDIAEDLLDKQKVFDAVPVVHAHWIHEKIESHLSSAGYFNSTLCTCSNCHLISNSESRYCPDCGALMKEVKEDAD